MEQMTLEQAKRIAQEGDYGLVPLTRELYADAITPTEVMRILKNISRHCYMLESAEDNKRWGRYTFLGYEPALEITCRNGSVQIKNSTPHHPGGGRPRGVHPSAAVGERKIPAGGGASSVYRRPGGIFFLRLH